MKDFGLGISLYFNFMKFLITLFAIFSVISLLPICYNMYNFYISDFLNNNDLNQENNNTF